MAGMKWIRIDTQMFENPKLLYLKEDKQFRAIVVHLEGMTYSGRHALAGFIPKAALRVIGATSGDANRLVNAGLWDIAQGGWMIHDWSDYQMSADDMEKRRERAQRGAAGRWKRGDDRPDNVVNLNA